jgi:hypothetical protein
MRSESCGDGNMKPYRVDRAGPPVRYLYYHDGPSSSDSEDFHFTLRLVSFGSSSIGYISDLGHDLFVFPSGPFRANTSYFSVFCLSVCPAICRLCLSVPV